MSTSRSKDDSDKRIARQQRDPYTRRTASSGSGVSTCPRAVWRSPLSREAASATARCTFIMDASSSESMWMVGTGKGVRRR